MFFTLKICYLYWWNITGSSFSPNCCRYWNALTTQLVPVKKLELLSCNWIQTVKHANANHPNTIGNGNPQIFKSRLSPWCFLPLTRLPCYSTAPNSFFMTINFETLSHWSKRSHNTMPIAVSVSRKHFFFQGFRKTSSSCPESLRVFSCWQAVQILFIKDGK